MKARTLLLISMGLCVPLPALAYIDPGTGSAIASAIIALFVGITVAVKGYWYKIKSLVMGKPKTPDTPAAEDKAIDSPASK